MLAPRHVRPAPFWWDLVEESLQEAEFLWRRRQAALESSDYVLAELSRFIEERLLGCLDGVMLAGEAAHERLLIPALLGEEIGLVSAAAWCLATSGERGLSQVTAAIERAQGPNLSALQEGLALVQRPDLCARLEALRGSASPLAHAALLGVLAFRGQGAGSTLHDLVRHCEPALAAAALTAARFDARAAATWAVELGLAHVAMPCRLAATETGLVLGLEGARRSALELQEQPWRPELQRVWGLSAALNLNRRSALEAALGDSARVRGAAWALGFIGTREAADVCVELIAEDRVSGLALDSFCNIVGCDPITERVAVSAHAPDETEVLDQDDSEADLRLPVEESAPLPDSARVRAFWAEKRARFAPEQRYQRGRVVITASDVRELLWDLPLARRPVLSLELAARTNNAEHFNPRAWCREQRARLNQLTQVTPETAPTHERV